MAVVNIPVTMRNIGGISVPIALLALAGCVAFLGVAYHDDWAKSMFGWVLGIAIVLHVLWWLSKQ